MAKFHTGGNLTCKMTNLGPLWGELVFKMEPSRAKFEPSGGQVGAKLSQVGTTWANLGPSWGPSWGQVGAKLALASEKIGCQDDIK